jgi:hypothetical protein
MTGRTSKARRLHHPLSTAPNLAETEQKENGDTHVRPLSRRHAPPLSAILRLHLSGERAVSERQPR